MCDAQMLARFAEGIHLTLRVIPDAQTQERAAGAGTATPGFGSHGLWRRMAACSATRSGPAPCVNNNGAQPFYQISSENSTACCSPGFHVDPIDSAILWRGRRTVHPPMDLPHPGLTQISQQTCGFAERFNPDGCGRDLVHVQWYQMCWVLLFNLAY